MKMNKYAVLYAEKRRRMKAEETESPEPVSTEE
jgi:hypothetical protein